MRARARGWRLAATVLLATCIWALTFAPTSHAAFPNPTVLDSFDRADAFLGGTTSSSGAAWSGTRIETAGGNSLRVLGTRAGVSSIVQNGYLTPSYGPDVDVAIDVPVLPLNGRYVALFSRIQSPGGGTADYYGLIYTHSTSGTSTWWLRRYVNSVPTLIGSDSGVNLAAGDALGLRVTGTGAAVEVTAYIRSGGSWNQVVSATDTSGSRITAAGHLGLEIDDTTTRVDDLVGGTTTTDPVLGGTSLSTAGCTLPAALSFPAFVGGGSAVTTADCTLSFGSADSTAQLRMRQADGAGTALTRMTGGETNTGFGTAGVRQFNPTGQQDRVGDVVALPDGSVLVVGSRGTGPVAPYVLKLDSAGQPVPGFGAAGVATWNIPIGGDDLALEAAVQADGRILVVGSTGGDAVVTRLTSSGAVDTSFSGDGFVSIDSGSASDQATSVAVRPDGRILVAGNAPTTWGAWAVQLLADGRRDTDGFGGPNGVATTSFGAGSSAFASALAPDGSLYVAGGTLVGGKPMVVRFDDDGVPAAGFGELTIGTQTTATSALLQPDGKLLLSTVGPAADTSISRFRRDGAIDTTFGVAGTRVVDPTAAAEQISSITLDPAGNVLATLVALTGGGDAGIARLRPDGALDSSFDGDGVRIWTQHASDWDAFHDLVVGPTGAITAVGERQYGATADWEVLAAQVGGGSIADYAAGGTWASGSMFGACLRRVDGLGTTATWTAHATCPASDGAYWNDIPANTTGAEVASTAVAGVVDAAASVRFGARIEATTQGGAYVAPITVEVIAPNLEAPANTALPTISGTATVRKVLTATTGTWTGSATITHAYQWRRCNAAGASCVDIAAATAPTYRLVTADAGSTIRVVVTATNTEGDASATSNQTAVVAAAAASGLQYLTGFEHRTASDIGGGISVGINPNAGGTATPETTVVHSGSAAMRFVAAPGQYQWDVDLPLATQRSATARVYVNLQSYPTGNVSFSQLEGTVAADLYCEMIVDPSGTIGGQIWRGSNSAFDYEPGPTLQLNRWYLIEYTCDASNAIHTIDWRVDGQPQAQVSANGATPDWIEGFQMGIDSDTPWNIVIDDVAVSRAITDYPLGPARTLAFAPDGVGAVPSPASWSWTTNNFGATTSFVAGDANQSPGRATLVDEWPVTTGGTADAVHQSAAGTLDLHVADSPEPIAPTAVSILGAHRENGSGGNNITVSGVSGATQVAYNVDPWAGGPVEYWSGVLPTAPGGATWTDASFDALDVRLDSSGLTPRPRTDSVLVEAEYPVEETTRNVTAPTILGAPKVGATLLATTGTWSPNPTSYAYQWRRCNTAGASCIDIPAATAVTYVPVALDAAGTLRVRVTAIGPGGNQSASSAQTTIVAPGAPTLTYLNGFESGTLSTNGAGLYDTVLNATASSDITRNGRYALRTSSNGATESYAARNTGGTVAVSRFAVLFEELPTANGEIAEITAGGFSCDLDYANGRFRTEITTTQSSTMLVQPGRWYVIDMRCSVGGANRVLDWMVDGVPQTTISDAMAASTISAMSLGTTGGTLLNGTVRYDDWALSTTSANYPLGAGKVLGLKPEATLTHTTHASFEQSTDGAASWTPLTAADDNRNPGTAALLDEWPIQYVAATSGDLIRQVATGGNLDYALSDAGETGAVNAVRVIGSHHAGAPANAQNVEVRSRLAAGTTTNYSNEVPTGSISYHAGLMNTRPGGGAWTGPDLDSLHLELDSTNVGAGGDRPWTHALLAEADVPVGAMPTNATLPGVALPYDVPKQGDELRAADGTWTGVPVIGHRYAWLRCDSSGAACAAIPGATGPTYVLQAADVASRIRVLDLAVSHAGAQGARSAPTELVSTQPTPWYVTGFEHGVASAAGQGVVTQLDAATSVVGSFARSGGYSMRSNSVGAGAEWEQDMPATSTVAVGRLSLYLDALPSGNSTFLEVVGGGSRAARLRITPAGGTQVDLYDGASAQAVQNGPTLQTGRWYQFDLRVDGTGATWRIDWRVDGAAQPASTYNLGSPAAFNQFDVGDGNNSTWLSHIDDVVYSTVSTDFPIGNARITSLAVDGVGSGGTLGNFGPAPDTAWAAAMAEIPMSATTTFIQQTAITSSLTDHVPFTNSDPGSSQDAIGVRGVASYGATAAGTNHVAMRVRRPGDTLAAAPSVFSGNAEVATISYAGAMIPAPAGGWTATSLAGTDWLVGFSTDVSPVPRVHGLLLEVAYRG